jgi:aminopeptidase-like protein
MSKIYIRKVYEDSRYTISFGTDKDVKDWKAEEKEWIEQDLSVADDSIKLLCELKKNNLDVVLQKINEEIRDANKTN